MKHLLKVVLVLMVVTACWDLMDAQKSRKRKGRRSPWLKEATSPSEFKSIESHTEKFIANIRKKVASKNNMSDFDLVKTCTGLFNKTINYKERNKQKGLAEVVLRMVAFHDLLQEAKDKCNNNLDPKLTKRRDEVIAALSQYVTKMGRRPASPQYTCHLPDHCKAVNSDDNKEQLLVIARQLQCFLERLNSTTPLECPWTRAKGLKSQKKKQGRRRKGKGKRKKARGKKELKAALNGMLKTPELAWDRTCQDGKITVVLNSPNTSAQIEKLCSIRPPKPPVVSRR